MLIVGLTPPVQPWIRVDVEWIQFPPLSIPYTHTHRPSPPEHVNLRAPEIPIVLEKSKFAAKDVILVSQQIFLEYEALQRKGPFLENHDILTG